MEPLEAEPTDIEPTEAIIHNNQYMPLLHNNQYAPLAENDEDIEDNKENTGVDIDDQKSTGVKSESTGVTKEMMNQTTCHLFNKL